jgi:hypothetical protein
VSTYAWIITKDHLAEPGDTDTDVGTTGPSDAPDDLIALLSDGKGHTFRMYDDDGELYYTGRLVARDDEMGEDECYGPLGDFGMPNAGAVTITYAGHKEWDCG